MGGIENGGWKVVFNSEPAKLEGRRGNAGDVVFDRTAGWRATAVVGDSIVGGPAFEAGISSGMKVVGVNGRVFTHGSAG